MTSGCLTIPLLQKSLPRNDAQADGQADGVRGRRKDIDKHLTTLGKLNLPIDTEVELNVILGQMLRDSEGDTQVKHPRVVVTTSEGLCVSVWAQPSGVSIVF